MSGGNNLLYQDLEAYKRLVKIFSDKTSPDARGYILYLFEKSVESVLQKKPYNCPQVIKIKGSLDYYRYYDDTWTFVTKDALVKTNDSMKKYACIKIVAKRK